MSWGIRVPTIDVAASRKSRAIAVLTDVKKAVMSENVEFCCEDLEAPVSEILIDGSSADLAFPDTIT